MRRERRRCSASTSTATRAYLLRRCLGLARDRFTSGFLCAVDVGGFVRVHRRLRDV